MPPPGSVQHSSHCAKTVNGHELPSSQQEGPGEPQGLESSLTVEVNFVKEWAPTCEPHVESPQLDSKW